MAGGGGQSQTSNSMQFENSTTDKNPWKPAHPYLGEALQMAQKAAWNSGSIPMSAGPSNYHATIGEEMMLDNSRHNQMGLIGDQGLGGISSFLYNGGMSAPQTQALAKLNTVESNLDPYASGALTKSNPYLDEVLKKAMGDAAAASNAQFSAAGRYGSGAHSGALGKELGGIESQARLQDYYTQQQNQLAANQALAGIANQRAGIGQQAVNNFYGASDAANKLWATKNLPAQTMMDVGDRRQMNLQQYYDQLRAQPWADAANYSNIASQIGGMGGTSQTQGISVGQNKTTSSGGGSGIIGSILGGGMTGLSFLKNMGGLGGLGALFTGSDVRLKEDIKLVGETFDGQPIFSYRYKSGGPKVMGLMAQEVLKHKPEAVARDPESGMLGVNYDKATEDV